MRLAVGDDHAGYALKARLLDVLPTWGHDAEHLGAFAPDPVDFLDITEAACGAVLVSRVDRGILVCGTGVGACIAASKLLGIRAALCPDAHSAHQAVEHDDANVLCLGAQIVGERLALDPVRTHLAAPFADEEPFRRRLAKLAALEQQDASPSGTPGRST